MLIKDTERIGSFAWRMFAVAFLPPSNRVHVPWQTNEDAGTGQSDHGCFTLPIICSLRPRCMSASSQDCDVRTVRDASGTRRFRR